MMFLHSESPSRFGSSQEMLTTRGALPALGLRHHRDVCGETPVVVCGATWRCTNPGSYAAWAGSTPSLGETAAPLSPKDRRLRNIPAETPGRSACACGTWGTLLVYDIVTVRARKLTLTRGRGRMSVPFHPTPYADVNAVLESFLGDIRAILGVHFRGMYLDGSLALGDFNRETSDIDFIVTTDTALPAAEFEALRAMHARFNARDSPWATDVEAVYLPEDAFRRSDPENVPHLRIERGNEVLVTGYSDRTWITHWFILREHRVVLAGPDPRTIIDPIAPQDLRWAMASLSAAWGAALREDQRMLEQRGPLTYTVLTFCRMLYTLARGDVVSKPTAARWAQQIQEGRWSTLIGHALAWRKAPAPQDPVTDVERRDTLALLTYTLAQCQAVDRSPTPPSF